MIEPSEIDDALEWLDDVNPNGSTIKIVKALVTENEVLRAQLASKTEECEGLRGQFDSEEKEKREFNRRLKLQALDGWARLRQGRGLYTNLLDEYVDSAEKFVIAIEDRLGEKF